MSSAKSHESGHSVENPIFILCHARSGSTLLRYCLDSHPDIACPPETNLAIAFSAIQKTTFAAATGSNDEKLASTDETCRQVADRTVGEFMRSEGKRRWCEKSLSNISVASLLQRIYPSGQFLCLFRECTDVVMSAMDASRWGFRGYGLEDYTRQSDNHAMALVRFWVENTSLLYRFWEQNPKITYSLRYEDLVTDPERTLHGVFDFLGYEWHPEFAMEEHVFGNHHAVGHGDYKIGAETSFRPDIGRGWRVPRSMIPPALVDEANGLLEKLGYPPMDELHARQLRSNVTTESDAQAALLKHFRALFTRPTPIEWNHGLGEYVIVDTGELLRVDIISGHVAAHLPSPDKISSIGYQVLTDSVALLSILCGELDISVAIHEGQVIVTPYPSIALDDRGQFHNDLASIFREV